MSIVATGVVLNSFLISRRLRAATSQTKGEERTDGSKMHGRRRNFAEVGLVEVVHPETENVSEEEEDDGMQFPPLSEAFRSDGCQTAASGWGEPDYGRAGTAPSETGWGDSEDVWRVLDDLRILEEPEPEANSSRPAVDDWGYSREKNSEWETHSTWASPSLVNPGDDANWTTPDWCEVNDRRSKVGVKDDRYIRYDGEPVIVERREDVGEWCDHIRELGVTVLGFDTEWKPERRRGQDNTIALIQICFRDPSVDELQVILFHTIQTGMTQKLKDLLEDQSIIKAGVDLTCDKRKLDYHFGVRLQNWMDLDIEYSRKVNNGGGEGNNRVGMKRLVKLVLGLEMKKPKSLQTVNWERPLFHAAIQYGALDAYVCSRLYEELFEN
ncbi:hypothetical protein BSKO_03167 [Bryopsis sp. KO-2023]|nr:hypothetical protein BSKO_03167 [Bryopsis sp. KO-2023]